jgi:hypothetical protein
MRDESDGVEAGQNHAADIAKAKRKTDAFGLWLTTDRELSTDWG